MNFLNFFEGLPNELLWVAIVCFGAGIFFLVLLAGFWWFMQKGILCAPDSKSNNNGKVVKNLLDSKEEIKDNVLEIIKANKFEDSEGVNDIITNRLEQFSDEKCKGREDLTQHQYNELNDKILQTNNSIKGIDEKVGDLSVRFAVMESKQINIEKKVDNIGDKQESFYDKIDKFMLTLKNSHLTRILS